MADRMSIGEAFLIWWYDGCACCCGTGSMMLEMAGDALARKGVAWRGGGVALWFGGLKMLWEEEVMGAEAGPGGAGDGLPMVERMGS
jgi:hypothetical protein